MAISSYELARYYRIWMIPLMNRVLLQTVILGTCHNDQEQPKDTKIHSCMASFSLINITKKHAEPEYIDICIFTPYHTRLTRNPTKSICPFHPSHLHQPSSHIYIDVPYP